WADPQETSGGQVIIDERHAAVNLPCLKAAPAAVYRVVASQNRTRRNPLMQITLETLESRDTPSSVFQTMDGIVHIDAGNMGGRCAVVDGFDAGSVHVLGKFKDTGLSFGYDFAGVTGVVFQGGDGNDSYINASVMSDTVFGGAG